MRWHAEGYSLPEMDGFWRTRPNESRAPGGKVVYVDKTKIVGRHLWRPLWHIKILNDVRFDLFLSEELLQRVAQAKLRKLTIRPVVDIFVPQSR